MKIRLVILLISLQHVTYASDPALMAVFNSRRNNVSIKWYHSDSRVYQYVLQRSTDNITWDDIFREDAIDIKKNNIAKFSDKKCAGGKSYYRLKIARSQSPPTYSRTITVIIGKRGKGWLMYPIPISNIINLQYNGSKRIKGVITVYVLSMRGQIFNRLRLASTSRLIQIPVDNLGRGTYDVQIIMRKKIVWKQRFTK